MKKVKQIIKSLLCKHEWEEFDRRPQSREFDGVNKKIVEVSQVYFRCKKCGKERTEITRTIVVIWRTK